MQFTLDGNANGVYGTVVELENCLIRSCHVNLGAENASLT